MACAVEAVPREADAEDDGWADDYELPDGAHWDDECGESAWGMAAPSLAETVEELHRQAHGVAPLRLCRAEPCSRLELQQLDAIGGRRR